MSNNENDISEEEKSKIAELDKNVENAETALARGMAVLFTPSLIEIDAQIELVIKSQHELTLQIDKLTGYLQQFADKSQSPTLAAAQNKLGMSRRRIFNVNSQLRGIKERLDNIQSSIDNEIRMSQNKIY